MKKILIWALVAMVILSLTIASVGCKQKTLPTEKTEEAEEEKTEEAEEEKTEEAEEVIEEETPPEGKVTLRYAHGYAAGDRGGEDFIAILDEWASQYPNLELIQEIVVGDEMFTKIPTDASADNLPDIFNYWGGASISDLAKSGLVLEINEYMEVAENISWEDIPDAGWELFEIDGKNWGIPFRKFVSFFVYNGDIFNEYNLKPPTTYEEMVEVSKVLNANDIIPLNLGSKGGNPGHLWFSDLYQRMQNGIAETKGLNESWRFNTENTINTANLILQQREDGIFAEDTISTGDWAQSSALYEDEKAAMCYTMDFSLGRFTEEILAKSEFMQFPDMPGLVIDSSDVTMGGAIMGYILSAKSWADPDKQFYLKDIMEMLNSAEVQAKLFASGLYTPIREGVLDMVDESQLAEGTNGEFRLNILAESAGKDIIGPTYREFPSTEAARTYMEQMDLLFSGNQTAEGFANAVQEVLDDEKPTS